MNHKLTPTTWGTQAVSQALWLPAPCPTHSDKLGFLLCHPLTSAAVCRQRSFNLKTFLDNSFKFPKTNLAPSELLLAGGPRPHAPCHASGLCVSLSAPPAQTE